MLDHEDKQFKFELRNARKLFLLHTFLLPKEKPTQSIKNGENKKLYSTGISTFESPLTLMQKNNAILIFFFLFLYFINSKSFFKDF